MADLLEPIVEQRIAERLMLHEGLGAGSARQRARELHAKIAAYMANLPTITASRVAEATGEPFVTCDLYLRVRYGWASLRGEELEAEEQTLKREADVSLREHGYMSDELYERHERLVEEHRGLAADSLRRALALLRHAVRKGKMSATEAQGEIEEIERSLREHGFEE